ncbi:hypothetical protein BPS10C_198 [Bacillus phage BPS10C]|uniref:Uncharacterized protein n=1 Tax=Bacillus phage BPS10C TaxID=1277886 RepID=W5QUE0_9CAUD|nr:hypothetical protein BPS10C_198 [Bacillus phage BPS10C]AGI12195.1 hypothetical protein BPS10C_198 [Bacillus phage BPS10C]
MESSERKTHRNNEFYRAAVDHLMISEHDDKSSGKPFNLVTLHEGEFVVLSFDSNSVLFKVEMHDVIHTDTITDEEWIAIHTNKSVKEIMDRFKVNQGSLTITQVLNSNKPLDCKHNAYTAIYGESNPTDLKTFVKRLENIYSDDIRSIMTKPCFKSTITLTDVMFWEEN